MFRVRPGVLPKCLVCHFGLAVRLWVKSTSRARGNTHQLQYPLPKQPEEFRVAVTDNAPWQSVGLDHVLHEVACRVRRLFRSIGGYEVDHFCCTVRNCQDGVIGSNVRWPRG